MGIDVTFQPKTPTYVVDSSAPVTIDGRQNGVTSWRIRASFAAASTVGEYIKWAQGATNPGATTASAVGAIMNNQIGVNAGQTVYIEGIGAFLTFIGSVAAATGSLEVTGGQGGSGG